MRLHRGFRVVLLFISLTGLSSAEPLCRERNRYFAPLRPFIGGENRQRLFDLASFSPGASYHSEPATNSSSRSARRADKSGIREIVPKNLQDKYERWKEELLSTEFGRREWDTYANNKDFLLTIVLSEGRKYGAGTDDYEWSDDGRLVAATITLGKELDKGYPDPIYYPVMNSLSDHSEAYQISGNILASTKMSHEIGHVKFTAGINSKLFQRQNRLMASYYKIFLSNGYNTGDPRLVDLAGQLGANPIAIWEDREYWSEVNAMQYLTEKINREPFFCSVFNRIRRNVNSYARNYQERFEQIADPSRPADCR